MCQKAQQQRVTSDREAFRNESIIDIFSFSLDRSQFIQGKREKKNYCMLWFLLESHPARPRVINFDENIKNTLNVCGMSKEVKRRIWIFFIYFVGAIIIDNYLECGWGNENYGCGFWSSLTQCPFSTEYRLNLIMWKSTRERKWNYGKRFSIENCLIFTFSKLT